MTAMLAAVFLSFGLAKHAIRVDAQRDKPTHADVRECHRLTPRRVRCHLYEEVIEAETDQTLYTVLELDGIETVTLKHGILRVHRGP